MVQQTWSSGTFTSNTAGATGLWRQPAPARSADDPVLMGSGPPECSSCTALSVVPGVIWDVNGYYRELGVGVRANRKQLRIAYQAKDGQSSARLTYVFRQLLQPDVRFAYDCTPLGELFMDRYVQEMLDRKMKTQKSNRMANLADLGVNLDMIDEEAIERDIWAEMGIETEPKNPTEDTPSETVDDRALEGKDVPRPAKFEWSYYLWSTRLVEDPSSLGRLAEWQRLLVNALSREGVNLRFAVGYHGKPHPWLQAQIGYRTVFLLNVLKEPTEAMAADIARQVRLDG
jgi:hypothetical protein